jgi:tight adherence protein C
MIGLGIGGVSSAIFLPPSKQGSLRLLLIIGGAGLGWLLPDIIVKNKAQRRAEILRKAMPDALDLMVICAEAGLGLDSALDRVGKEIGMSCPELAEEIGLTSVEMNFLPDRHTALRGLAERVPLPSVNALVNTLIQTEKYGTPLAQSLRVLSAEMREERMMKAEEKPRAFRRF